MGDGTKASRGLAPHYYTKEGRDIRDPTILLHFWFLKSAPLKLVAIWDFPPHVLCFEEEHVCFGDSGDDRNTKVPQWKHSECWRVFALPAYQKLCKKEGLSKVERSPMTSHNPRWYIRFRSCAINCLYRRKMASACRHERVASRGYGFSSHDHGIRDEGHLRPDSSQRR